MITISQSEVQPKLNTEFRTIREEYRSKEYDDYVSPLFDKVVQDDINQHAEDGYNFVAYEENFATKNIMLVYQMVTFIEHRTTFAKQGE